MRVSLCIRISLHPVRVTEHFKEFVEEILSNEFWAMVSTCEVKQWKHIPKPELVSALREKSKNVVRSDKEDKPDPPDFNREGKIYVEVEIPI